MDRQVGRLWPGPPSPAMFEAMIEAAVEPRPTTIRLADGRHLAYAECGDPDGTPIIHSHGVPGCRLEQESQSALLARLGARVITPDRPGYGGSDPRPGRSVADWAADVAELADRLGLERLSMTALSGGGVFALACAALIPERISRVVAIGCPAPMNVTGLAAVLQPRLRLGLAIAAAAPSLFEMVCYAMSFAVRRNPEFFVDHANLESAADRAWLDSATVRAGAIATVKEAFRAQGRGYAQDVAALARPWGFAIERIEIPVLLWHGDADTVIPLSHGKYLASVIPNATLKVCPGEAHMLMWNHLPEVILAAASAYDGIRSLAPVA